MAQTQTDDMGNFGIILGDPIELTIESLGTKGIQLSDTGVFMIKSDLNLDDTEAEITVALTCTTLGKFEIAVDSTSTLANLPIGDYYYSVKQTIDMNNSITIVPDWLNQKNFPKITVGCALING